MMKLRHMVAQPIFIVLTLVGNTVILSSATALYFLEHETNPQIRSFLDAIWWSVSTVTTVGYGDVSPHSPAGRVVGLLTMILGTALFWSYTALFAQALVSEDITDVETELRSLARALERLSAHADSENEETRKWVRDLQAHLEKHPRSGG